MITHLIRDYPSEYEDLLSDAMHSRSVWSQLTTQRVQERNGVEPL